MKKHTSARGRTIDMTAMAKQHETTRAVSNVPVNAKGDIIDSRDNVVVSRENIKKAYYKDSVPGTEEKLSIKEDNNSTAKQETQIDETFTEDNTIQEINRTKRERKDGSVYYEVEYSDGSIEEVNE